VHVRVPWQTGRSNGNAHYVLKCGTVNAAYIECNPEVFGKFSRESCIPAVKIGSADIRRPRVKALERIAAEELGFLRQNAGRKK